MAKNKIKLLIFLVSIGLISVFFIFLNQKNSSITALVTSSPKALISPSPSPDTINQEKFYAPILLYHHIADRKIQNSYYVSPKIFEEQLSYLKENGYHVISLDDIYLTAHGQKNLPDKPIAITFDDGVTDQFTNGFPILKKYGYTATFFIKLNNVGTGKGGMTWDQIKELFNSGMSIGSHTVNHDNLNVMAPSTLKYELEESKKVLESHLGIKIDFLSYPGGVYSQSVILAAKYAGYLAAVTTRHRVYQEIKKPDDLFTFNRVHIDDEMPTFINWIQGKNLK